MMKKGMVGDGLWQQFVVKSFFFLLVFLCRQLQKHLLTMNQDFLSTLPAMEVFQHLEVPPFRNILQDLYPLPFQSPLSNTDSDNEAALGQFSPSSEPASLLKEY